MIPSIDSFLQCAARSHLKALPVQSPLITIILFKHLFLSILPQALSTYTASIFFSARQDLIYVSPRFQHRLLQPFLNSSGKGWVCSPASPRTTCPHYNSTTA